MSIYDIICARLRKGSIEVGDPALGVQMRIAADIIPVLERERATLRLALLTIAAFPITGDGNMDACNMANIAKDACGAESVLSEGKS